jgi:hypothetical protein
MKLGGRIGHAVVSAAVMATLFGACASTSWDGQQWYRVTVHNDTREAARLVTPCRDCTPTRDRILAVLGSGAAYTFTADLNNDPQAVRVTSPSGRPLGCLVLRHPATPSHASARLSSVAPCPAQVRMVP